MITNVAPAGAMLVGRGKTNFRLVRGLFLVIMNNTTILKFLFSMPFLALIFKPQLLVAFLMLETYVLLSIRVPLVILCLPRGSACILVALSR